jgi:hypothetical protein
LLIVEKITHTTNAPQNYSPKKAGFLSGFFKIKFLFPFFKYKESEKKED